MTPIGLNNFPYGSDMLYITSLEDFLLPEDNNGKCKQL